MKIMKKMKYFQEKFMYKKPNLEPVHSFLAACHFQVLFCSWH